MFEQMAPCEVYSMPFTTVLFTMCYSCVTDFSRKGGLDSITSSALAMVAVEPPVEVLVVLGVLIVLGVLSYLEH